MVVFFLIQQLSYFCLQRRYIRHSVLAYIYHLMLIYLGSENNHREQLCYNVCLYLPFYLWLITKKVYLEFSVSFVEQPDDFIYNLRKKNISEIYVSMIGHFWQFSNFCIVESYSIHSMLEYLDHGIINILRKDKYSFLTIRLSSLFLSVNVSKISAKKYWQHLCYHVFTIQHFSSFFYQEVTTDIEC